ncbi:MAG TPA: flagellar basal body-associated FliL family protein [Verrucomicrobiae bacterium]|nr:flagellar basal body-associated FliL family protein [Verrucomicrobiae bacterium]
MPANPQIPDDAAAAAETPAPAPKTGGGFKAWLPLIITILLMPALAYAMTTFVLLPRIQSGLGITAPASDSSSKPNPNNPGAKKITVAMNKLLVNVAGTMGSRYLLVSISAVSTDPDFAQKMTDNDAALRDAASSALAAKTLADLEKPDERNLIRTELLTGFNNILGSDEVQEIYLTEFAIQ